MSRGDSGRPGASRSRATAAAALVTVALILAACTAGPNDVASINSAHLAGFWPGLWHGLISPITFLISLFDNHVTIYDVHNNGNWYNFGFMLGVSAVFSGGAGGARSGANVVPRRSTPRRSTPRGSRKSRDGSGD